MAADSTFRKPARRLHGLPFLGALLALILTSLIPGMILGPPAAAQTLPPGLGGASDSAAPEDPEVSPDLAPDEFQRLLGRLSDQQTRELLIEWQATRAAAPPPETRDSFVETSRDIGERISQRLAELAAEVPSLPDVAGVVGARIESIGGLPVIAMALGIAFVAGYAARYFWRRSAVERQNQIAKRNAHLGPYATLGVIFDAALFLMIDLSGVIVFWVAAMTALYMSFSDADLRLLVSTYVAAVALLLATQSVMGLLFPISWPVYRVLPLDDVDTRRLHAATLTIVGLWAFGFPSVDLAFAYGIRFEHLQILVIAIATLFVSFSVFFIWMLSRAPSLRPTRDEADTSISATLAANWPLIAIGYAVLVWLVSMTQFLIGDDPAGVGQLASNSLSLIVGLVAFDLIIGCYLRAQAGLGPELADAIRRTVRLLLALTGAVAFLRIWGFDPENFDSQGPFNWLVRASIDVTGVVVVGYALWDLVRTAIDLRMAEEEPDDGQGPGEGEGGGLGVSRAATLLPLFRSFALVLILLVSIFTAAASLGVNVAPLIAGAGVIGIAIGFGAQTLVRDIVSGVFFLVDDAFRRGEYIEVGGVAGTVEKISLRSFQLRHPRGAVHTIPFGEIQTLTNFSRDWVIMKLPLRLTFDTDPAQVKKIVKRIGQEMMEDPELGPKLQDPPKSQGVIQMEDSAMILRVKFKAIPGEQWVLRRELFHRVRAAFEEAGIRFANREVTVHVAADAPPEQARSAAGAAARRIIQDAEDADGEPEGPVDDR